MKAEAERLGEKQAGSLSGLVRNVSATSVINLFQLHRIQDKLLLADTGRARKSQDVVRWL